MSDETSSPDRLLAKGFRAADKDEFTAIMKASSSPLPEPEYFERRRWYIHDGSCTIGDADLLGDGLRGVNIVVKGDLHVDGILRDESVAGIVVLGDLSAGSVILENGPAVFMGEVRFKNALLVRSPGYYVGVRRPKGPFVYVDGDAASVAAEDRDDVSLLVDESRGKVVGEINLLKPEYVTYYEEADDEDDEQDEVNLDAGAIVRALIRGDSIFRHR